MYFFTVELPIIILLVHMKFCTKNFISFPARKQGLIILILLSPATQRHKYLQIINLCTLQDIIEFNCTYFRNFIWCTLIRKIKQKKVNLLETETFHNYIARDLSQ